ncbi:Processing alpha glucosidase I [Saitoella coloradoensis]
MTEKDVDCERVTIIGGGIMGVCTAFYLSRHPRFKAGMMKVTVIEEGEIAQGASGKAGGFLALDWHGPDTASLAALSYRLHKELAEEHGGREEWSYREVDSLSVSTYRSSNPSMSEPNRSKYGVDPEGGAPDDLLASDLDRQRRRKAGKEGWDGIDWLDEGVVKGVSVMGDQKSTAQVFVFPCSCARFHESGMANSSVREPYRFTRSIARLADEGGVEILTNTRAEAFSSTEKVLGVEGPSGMRNIPTDKLLIAAGPWTGRLTRTLLDTEIPVHEYAGHSITLRPSRRVTPHAVFFSSTPAGTGTSEMFARGQEVYVAGENGGVSLPAGVNDVEGLLNEKRIEELVTCSNAVSEELRGGEVLRKQLCFRPVTRDGVPIMGQIAGRGNVWVCAGHGP